MSKVTKYFTMDFYGCSEHEGDVAGSIETGGSFGSEALFEPVRLPGMDGVIIQLECDTETKGVKVVGFTTIDDFINQTAVVEEKL